MGTYSYSSEINRNNVVFRDFDLDRIRKMFRDIFAVYSPKIKDEMFDSFCEDFFELAKEIHAGNERIWRMIITDMLFSYDDWGCLETGTADNAIKRRQFAIMAKVVVSTLRSA